MKYEKQYMMIFVNRFQDAEQSLRPICRISIGDGVPWQKKGDYVRNEASERRSALLIFDGITKKENRKAK